MKIINEKKVFLKPSEQLYLYEYMYQFDLFKKLIESKRLPKCMLFSGSKGIGKATFTYHLINYFLSINEKYKYSIENKQIDPNNPSFGLINSNVHPNFYNLDSDNYENEIKIDQVRNLLKFLKNTTYNNNLKLVLIDNIENLNKNSSNALLKCLEEKNDNTYFFLIHDDSKKILRTIKSRSIEFRFYLNNKEKYNIFIKLAKQYFDNNDYEEIFNNFYFESPGNLIKYMLSFDFNKFDFSLNSTDAIFSLIEKYLKEDNLEILKLLTIFVDKFYNQLYLSKSNKINILNYNRSKILKLINETKLYNLDKKNTFVGISEIIQTDAR